MNYYILPKIGTGTSSDDAFRPDVPSGIPYVCQETNEGNFLVGTSESIPNQTTITDLQGACTYYGLNYDDVLKWMV
jgi:hypothetical protein